MVASGMAGLTISRAVVRSGMAAAGIYIALMRGVNVGGHNRLPMKDLSCVFKELQCSDVQTYIQSGNVVFRASAELAPLVPTRVSSSISTRFGFSPPVVVRNLEEMVEIVAKNPFIEEGVDPATLHVAFLVRNS